MLHGSSSQPCRLTACPALTSPHPKPGQVKLADDVAKRSKPPAPKPDLPQFLQTLMYQARRRAAQGGRLWGLARP